MLSSTRQLSSLVNTRLVWSNRDFFLILQIYLQYLLSYILKFLKCIHAGNARVPPRVLAPGPKPCGGNKEAAHHRNRPAMQHATKGKKALHSSTHNLFTITLTLSSHLMLLFCSFLLYMEYVKLQKGLKFISNQTLIFLPITNQAPKLLKPFRETPSRPHHHRDK